MRAKKSGADKVRWDLSVLFSGPDDPKLETAIDEVVASYAEFDRMYRGKLAERLGDAIRAFSTLERRTHGIFVYLYLLVSADQTNEPAKAKKRSAEERVALASGTHLTFFGHELVGIPDDIIEGHAAKDESVRKAMPWIRQERTFKPYLLSEPVEEALTKRSPFGAGAWAEFFDEIEADLKTEWNDRETSLTEMFTILTNDQDPAVRAKAMAKIHEMLGGFFHKYSARTLNQIVRAKATEDRERGYAHPMASRNMGTMIDDDVVEALHTAVRTAGADAGRRFYRLKAKLLGLKKLAWSDRNAPMPFEDTAVIPYDDALDTVVTAYESFSPALADIIRDIAANKRIDAPVVKGKQTGAYNYSMMLDETTPITWVFMNYLGTSNDVMTLAHELGHACHGILAGQAQGQLLQHAPMAYAETASVFGEMTTFTYLRARLEESGDKEALLSLLMDKANSILNTMLRQMSFSEFERKVHGAGRQLSPVELDEVWMAVTKEFYGDDGDVFTYRNTDRLWCYVSHFHNPFYVYAYACGELLTQSLYARKDEYGERFEPLYLDLLRKGGSEGIVDLLAPFGLDPKDPEFWTRGIDAALSGILDDAEKLAADVLKPKAIGPANE